MSLSLTISPTERPQAIIFLDIDGVLTEPPCSLIGSGYSPREVRKLYETLDRLYGFKYQYSRIEHRVAHSHLFNPSAVDHLEGLIRRVSEVARVGIVVSSSWRTRISVEDLRDQVFARWSFARYIIGKTPDDTYIDQNGSCLKSRGAQIDFWIKEQNHKAPFVIFDDFDNPPDWDEAISARFPNNFVQIDPNQQLQPIDVERAHSILTEALVKISDNPV